MKYAILVSLLVSGLVYAVYYGPLPSRISASLRWILAAVLLVFVYSLGIWSEVIWFRSTSQDITLWLMLWERRGSALIIGACAALVAFLATSGLSKNYRGLVVILATFAGAITGLGIWELIDLVSNQQ